MKAAVFRSSLIVMLLTNQSLSAADMNSAIAILGDSISTGAAAHDDLAFDDERLLNVFVGNKPLVITKEDRQLMKDAGLVTDDLRPPQRLAFSKREFQGPLSWVAKHALFGFSHLYLDMEEYSWGYLLGKHLGIKSANILIAAEDGARMQAATRQVDRVLDYAHGVLPGKMFFFFTGNDLCGPTMAFVTEKDKYGEGLKKSIDYLIKNGRPPRDGTDVYVLDPIGLLQLTQSPAILDKVVFAHGEEQTCSQLQSATTPVKKVKTDLSKFDIDAVYFMQFFPRSPATFCATIMGLSPDGKGEKNQITLANRIRSYREVIGDIVRDFSDNDKVPGGFRFHHITSTGQLAFNGEDIAQDCFHLSLKGQLRLAKVVLEEMTGPGREVLGQ